MQLAGSVAAGSSGAQSEQENTLNQLLVEMDGERACSPGQNSGASPLTQSEGYPQAPPGAGSSPQTSG